MKIINPLSPKETKEDIKTVLRVLAGQGGCDGMPYDQMQKASDYIEQLEAKIKRLNKKLNLRKYDVGIWREGREE